LRDGLEEVNLKRKPRPDDAVLYNPDNGRPFAVLGVEGGRKRLYQRMKALGERAGVRRVTPHCFRDTFACDMLARGTGIYDVAMMLADTVDTIQKHYAQLVPAARDAALARMDSSIGIEERAKLAAQRGKKVVEIA
jgi:integrase